MISDELLHFTAAQERFVPHPYLDPVGLPTIGYGHRIPDMDHPDITIETGDKWLREDLEAAQAIALRFSPGLLLAAPRRLDAITDFCFNAGGGNYAGSRLRRAIDRQDWSAAAREIRRWKYAHNPDGTLVELPGLVKRREVCAQWLEYA